MTDFSGSAILVLGGSRGISAEIARRFTADSGDDSLSYFGTQGAAEALAEETGRRGGRGARARSPCPRHPGRERRLQFGGDPLALDADAIDRMIDVNVRSPYHVAAEAGWRMTESAIRVWREGSPAISLPTA